MASFSIEWKESARKELRKVGKGAVARIIKAAEDLGRNPHPSGCKKVRGSEHTYRIRVGDYRIIYSVYPDLLVIEIVRVGHRRDVYRGFT